MPFNTEIKNSCEITLKFVKKCLFRVKRLECLCPSCTKCYVPLLRYNLVILLSQKSSQRGVGMVVYCCSQSYRRGEDTVVPDFLQEKRAVGGRLYAIYDGARGLVLLLVLPRSKFGTITLMAVSSTYEDNIFTLVTLSRQICRDGQIFWSPAKSNFRSITEAFLF